MEKNDLLGVSDDEQEYQSYFSSGVPEPFRVQVPSQASGSEMPHQASVPTTSRQQGLLPTPASPQKQFFPCTATPTFSAQPGPARGRGGFPAEHRGPGIQPFGRHSSQHRPNLQSPELRTDLPGQRSQAVVHPLPRVAMQERSESRCTTAIEGELQIDLSFETPLPSQKGPTLTTVADLEDTSRPGSSVSTGSTTKQPVGRKESLQADETSDEDGENVGNGSMRIEKPTTSNAEAKTTAGDDLDRLLQALQKTVTVPAEGPSKKKRPMPIWGAVVDTGGMKVRSPRDNDPIVRGRDRHCRFRVDLQREEQRLKRIREAPQDQQEELLAAEQWTFDDILHRVRYMPPVREGDATDDTPHLKLLHEHCNVLHEHYLQEVRTTGVYRTSKERKEGWLQDRKKLDHAEKDLAAEREKVVGLTKDLGTANGKVTSLEGQLASTKDDVAKLEKRLDAAKKQLRTQADQLKTKDHDARAAVQKELSAKDADIEGLKDQLKKLKAKQAGAAVRSTTDAEKDKADKELKRLRKANKDLTDANEKLQEQLRKNDEKKLMKDVFGDDEHDDQGTQTDPLPETQLIEELTEKLKISNSDVHKLMKQCTQAELERKSAKAAAKTDHLARRAAEKTLEEAKAQFDQEKEAAQRSFGEEFQRYKEEAERALKEATPAAEAELEKMDALAKKIETQNDVIKMQAERLEGARKVREAMQKRACLKCSSSTSEASTSTSLGTVEVAVGTDDRPEPEYTVEGESGLLTPPAGISAAPSMEEEPSLAKRARLEESAQLEQVMNTRFRPEPREGDEDSPPLEFNERKPNVAELRKRVEEREEHKKAAVDLAAKFLETLERTLLSGASTSTTPSVSETSNAEARQPSTSTCATPEQPSSSGTPQSSAQTPSTPQPVQQTPTPLEALLQRSPRTTEEIRVNPTTLLAPTGGTLLPLHVATDATARTMAATSQRSVKGMQQPQQQAYHGMPARQPQGQTPPQQPQRQTPPQQPHGQTPPHQIQQQMPPLQPQRRTPPQQPHGQTPPQQPHGQMSPQQLAVYRQWLMQQQQHQQSMPPPQGGMPPSMDPAQFQLHQQQAYAAQRMMAAQQQPQFQMHSPTGTMIHGQFSVPGAPHGAHFQGMPQFAAQLHQQPAPSGAAGQGPSPPGRGRKRKNQQQRTPPQAAAQQPPQAVAQKQRTPPQAVAQQQQQMARHMEAVRALITSTMLEIQREHPGSSLTLEQYRQMLVNRHPHLENVINHFLTNAATTFLQQPRAP